MALATLSIDLVAQLAQLQQGMDKAGRLAEKAVGQIEAKFSGLTRVAGTVGAAFAGVLSVAGLSTFLRSTIDGIDKLNDLADATGSTIENLSALEDAAARTGTGIDVVGDALIKLNKVIGEARPGSEQAATLKAIGLSAEELKRIDPAEALLRTAQALSGFADDGNKARLVQDLFGKSIKDVAPLLKDLVEQGQLNATVTQEQAEAVDRFKRQSAQLNKNLTDLARDITGVVVPALNKLFDRSKKEGFFSALFGEDEEALAIRKAKAIGQRLQRVTRELDEAIAAGDQERIERLRGQLFLLSSAATQATDKIKGVAPSQTSARDLLRGIEAGSAERPSAPSVGGPPPTAPRQPAAQEFGPFLPPALAGALKAIDDADEAKLAALREQLAELVRLVSQGSTVPNSVFAGLAEDIAKLDPAAREATAAQERLNKLLEEGKAVFAATRSPAEALAAELDRLNRLLQAGAIDWDTYARATFAAQDVFDNSLKPAIEEVSEFSREASRNIQDALGNSILQAMEGSTKSIGDLWVGMLKRMVAEAAAARLSEALLGKGFGGSTGQLGGWAGAAWGWLRGSFGGGAGGAAGGSIGDSVGSALGGLGKSQASAPGMVQNVYVQGDVGAKSLRAMRTVQAESEARMMRRGAY